MTDRTSISTWLSGRDGGRSAWLSLIALCVLGFAARLVTSQLFPSAAHPDEVFQYLEQAYRTVTGHGLVPWEYEYGARSWLLPWLLVPVAGAAGLGSSDPAVLRLAFNIFTSLLAVIGIAAAFRIGRLSGTPRAALFAALLNALWCELVYLSPHFLADTISGILLVSALAVGAKGPRSTPRENFWASLLFGLTIVVRPQLAPACAIAMLWMAGIRPSRRWLVASLGALVPVLLLAVTDWITWGVPFYSVITYLKANFGGIASGFGVEPPSYYLGRELSIWGIAAPLVMVTAVLAVPRAPVLAMVVLAVFATFSAVPHKEWRFIYPALPVLFCLCGIGSARAVELVSAWFRRPALALGGGLVLALAWLLLSFDSGSVRMPGMWQQTSGVIRGLELASDDPAACGVGIDPPDRWWRTGMVRLRGDMRLYAFTPGTADRFNYLLGIEYPQRADQYSGSGFSQVACYPQQICLYRRAGGCRPSSDTIRADPNPGVTETLRKLKLQPIR